MRSWRAHQAGDALVPSLVNEQVPCAPADGEATGRAAEPAPTVVDCVATLPKAMLPPGAT